MPEAIYSAWLCVYAREIVFTSSSSHTFAHSQPGQTKSHPCSSYLVSKSKLGSSPTCAKAKEMYSCMCVFVLLWDVLFEIRAVEWCALYIKIESRVPVPVREFEMSWHLEPQICRKGFPNYVVDEFAWPKVMKVYLSEQFGPHGKGGGVWGLFVQRLHIFPCYAAWCWNCWESCWWVMSSVRKSYPM